MRVIITGRVMFTWVKSLPYAVYLNDDIIAYVDLKKLRKAIVERKRASLIEPCLMAYGVSVNMGVDESVNYPKKLEGFPLKLHDPDMTEEKLVKAIEVCAGLVSGMRPVVEEVEEKIYEVRPSNIGGEEKNEEEEIEFERA